MDSFRASGWPIGLLLAGLALLLNGLYYCWARRRLDAWARQNQVSLIGCQWRWFLRGPYDALGKYVVFRIVSRNADGSERIGWVRLGGFWAGLFSDESHVLWERDP